MAAKHSVKTSIKGDANGEKQGLSQRQQQLLGLLGKYCRQCFLYKEPKIREEYKVRIRNDIHCKEQCPEWERSEKIQRRMTDMSHGLMVPNYIPYTPVGGWPVTALDDLVLGAMSHNLDDKINYIIRSHFEKPPLKRRLRKSTAANPLTDMTDVHSCPTSGFNRIRVHLAETGARMHQTKCGSDFKEHFRRTQKERLKREAGPEDDGFALFGDAEAVAAKERVRRGEILFLNTFKELVEKMLMLKIRHLKSIVPISLDALGTESDIKEKTRHKTGGPPIFRDLILADAPRWYLDDYSARSTLFQSRNSRFISRADPSLAQEDRHLDLGLQEIRVMFRKRWPPLWMSLAAAEQGFNANDPIANAPPHHDKRAARLKRKKSFTDIKNQRRTWAESRKTIARNVGEHLYREDEEKVEFFDVLYSTLQHLPSCRFYEVHQRIMDNATMQCRRARQKKHLYDCELPMWYRALGDKTREVLGNSDTEVNSIIESTKKYFRISPTHPKFARPKLALIVMSMPVKVICQVHVQRALQFLMVKVMGMNQDTLSQWLSIRGLPYVIITPI